MWWHAPFFCRLGRSHTSINLPMVDEVVEQFGAGVAIEFQPRDIEMLFHDRCNLLQRGGHPCWPSATSFNAGATARARRRGTCGRGGLGGLRVWACGKAWHPGPLDEGGHPGQGGHGRPRGNSLFASETQAMRLHRGGVSSNARPWMIQLVHGLGPRSDLNQKWSNNAKKTGLHVWRCLTGWRSAASRVNWSLHTTETFFLWQAGPYITRQRVPLTVVYDRHPTTPCPNEERGPYPYSCRG